ncbi:MAG: DUF2442 domain-containing protein [Thermoleophilaceae bacterium]
MKEAKELARVVEVEPLDGLRVRLGFDDGVVGELDLAPDLHGPMLEPLRDPAVFRQVRVDEDAGTIAWPNGVDLDPDALYEDIVVVSAASDPPRKG